MSKMTFVFDAARKWCSSMRKPHSQEWLNLTHKVTAAEQHYEALRASHVGVVRYIETHGVGNEDGTVSVDFDPAFLSSLRNI